MAKISTLKRVGTGWLVDGRRFEAVVVALSPGAAAALIEPIVPEAAAVLSGLTRASVAIVALGFRHPQVGMDLGAYGFLVARGERPTLLGCQYESSIFPGRAPPGTVLLRAVLGGTFAPRLVDEDEPTLVERTVADLRLIAGLDRTPDFSAVWRLRQVLPQYQLGHEARVRTLEQAVAQHRGLHLLTVGQRGVGLADCIRNATALAGALGPA
jgi:oxygen-dependent protoporphyrinogen oxidase